MRCEENDEDDSETGLTEITRPTQPLRQPGKLSTEATKCIYYRSIETVLLDEQRAPRILRQ